MDWETEQQMASLLLAEAAGLKKRAEESGVAAYLAKPVARARPNSLFLRATVKNVEQANRIAEVNEMWQRRRAEVAKEREKEVEKEMERERRRCRNSASTSTSLHNSRAFMNEHEGEDGSAGKRRRSDSPGEDDYGRRGHRQSELAERRRGRSKHHRSKVDEDCDDDIRDLHCDRWRYGDGVKNRRLLSREGVKKDWERQSERSPQGSGGGGGGDGERGGRSRTLLYHSESVEVEEGGYGGHNVGGTKRRGSTGGEGLLAANDKEHEGEENGLDDNDMQEFLQSRCKRGRGAVGSRMDEPGPYVARLLDDDGSYDDRGAVEGGAHLSKEPHEGVSIGASRKVSGLESKVRKRPTQGGKEVDAEKAHEAKKKKKHKKRARDDSNLSSDAERKRRKKKSRKGDERRSSRKESGRARREKKRKRKRSDDG